VGKPSPVWSLPPDLYARLQELRGAGLGAESIWKHLGKDLGAYAVTTKTLSNFFAHHPEEFGGTTGTREHLGRIADLLARSGIDPSDIGEVKTVRLSEWQAITKDADGEAQTHDLQGASIVLTPGWETGPAWQPVDRGPAIRLPKPPKPAAVIGGYERCFLWPDTQVGYRRSLDTLELVPFHDETAIACALAVLRAVAPQQVVVIGDFVDFAEFGTYEQEPGFALTVQPAIDRATLLLAEIRCAAPHARVVFIEGNHDRRLQKAIIRNALAAYGLRPGFTPPSTWPDLSVPHLLRMDELDVEYVGGYPAGLHWINENVAAVHGARVNSAGSTALRVIDDSRVSVVFGHVHRIELIHRTRQAFSGSKRSFAASIGCLCRTDGAVPSTKGSIDVFGKAVPTVENWQQGCGVLLYEPGDGRFHLDLVDIQDGRALLWGNEIVAPERISA
jgi:hypothetical protein